MMSDGLRSGSVMSLPVLSRELRIGFDPLIEILEKLAQINIVSKLSQHGWSMIRDAKHIQARELYQLLVFDPGVIPSHDNGSEINAWITGVGEHYSGADISLADLFDQASVPDAAPIVPV